MAYVDHAFSISDEDMMIETSYTVNNRPPVKEIALAVALLVFGALGIVSGFFMSYNRVGGDRGHGIFFIVLGCLLFIPQGFTTHGSRTMLTKDTKASPSLTYPQFSGSPLLYLSSRSSMYRDVFKQMG
ncbi:unnamed protein product [Brassica oleracea]